MIPSKNSLLALPLLLIAAASNFNPVSAVVTPFASKDDLKTAVNTYCADATTVFTSYGSIEDWNVSGITDMQRLFMNQANCNPPIGSWDVSNVVNFGYVFASATAFNQDISGWDVGSGLYFYGMFFKATAFNQDISGWDVSSGTNFRAMFNEATAFNQDISGWDVSSGTDFAYMFRGATAFNQDISNWDVSKGTDFDYMFYGATSFDQTLNCKWQQNTSFTTGPGVCTNSGPNCGSGDTTCPQPIQSIGGGGDPHYDMPNSQTLTVQALCELRVAASDNVYGLNLEMHTRHAEPQDQKAGKEYTVISHISLKLDDDVYELEGESGNLYKNGELFNLDDRSGDSAIESAGPYTITKSIAGRKNNQIQFFFVFADGSTIMLRANVHFKMAYFNINGRFGGARMRGLLGDTNGVIKGGLYKRNGELMAKTVKEVDIEEYANEWQVLESDAKLFRDPDYFPLAPHQCVFLDSGHGLLKSDGDIDGIANTLRANRRRLMEEDPLEKAEKLAQAEKACTNRRKFDVCVEDVIHVGIALADDIYYD